MNTFNVAAFFAANCRPRQLRLSPRAFHLLARPPSRVSQLQRRSDSILLRNVTNTAADSHTADHVTTATNGQVPLVSSSSEDNDLLEEEQEGGEDEDQEWFGLDDSALAERFENNKKVIKTWMRTVPKSVAIVSARRQDTPDRATGTVAATVSSFNTVAFEPDFYVSFNLKQNSSTLKVILETKYFAVTFPENSEHGMKLASRFARGDIPPPTKEEEVARYRTHRGRQAYFAKRGLQYAPCTVAATTNMTNPKAGFAFGMWFKYESSVPVGDHVVVIAKALPLTEGRNTPTWTNKSQPDSPFFAGRMTLGHVHGRYATGEEVRFESFKLDDKSRSSLTDVEKKAFCRSRLDTIGQAKRRRYEGTSDEDALAYKSFKHLLPEVQTKYQRYYMARLARLQSQEQPASEMITDFMADLAPWEQLLVRQKRAIPTRLLLEEKEVCLKRLALLELDSYDFQETSEADASDEELLEAVDDLPDDSPTKRREGLRHYWKTRLRHVNIAQLNKVMTNTFELELRSENLLHQLERSKSSIIAERRDWPVSMLQLSRRQYNQTLNYIQESLMRAWSGNEGAVNEKFVQQMLANYNHFVKTSNTLSWMIARRRLLDREIQGKDLQPRIPQDRDIIRKSKHWEWKKEDLDELIKETSEHIFDPVDREMSHETFQSLLAGVMDSMKAKEKVGSQPKKDEKDGKTIESGDKSAVRASYH